MALTKKTEGTKTTKTPAKSVEAKKPVAVKAAAVATEEKVEKQPEYGVEKDHDLPWCEKKVMLIKALKKLKAFDANRAATNSKVVAAAAELGFTMKARDVRHYSYHAAAGKDQYGNDWDPITAVQEADEGAGYVYYLTAVGQKIDPDKEFKKQELLKSQKAAAPKAKKAKAEAATDEGSEEAE